MIRAAALAAALALPTGAVGQNRVAELINAPCTETLQRMEQMSPEDFGAEDEVLLGYLNGMMSAAMGLAAATDQPADALDVARIISGFRDTCLDLPEAPTAGIAIMVFRGMAEDMLD